MKQNPGKNYRSERLVWLLVSLSGFIGACGQEAPVEQAEALNLANDLVQQFPANAEIAALRDQLAGSLHEDRK